jgi:outer membrane protein assembly factor BamE (lipoprotein component of BamABCDE complex)
MQKLLYISSFFFLLLSSCGKPLPSFDGLDLKSWKEDKNGCGTIRQQLIDQLEKQKEKIKSLSESEVVKLLGRPDKNELLKRNQKFYYYFLEPGPNCGNEKTEFRKLMIRFNAIGLAKEVSIE